MAPNWAQVLACFCLTVSLSQSAVVTTETMVITSSAPPEPTVNEVTTSEPSPPLKLTEMSVESEISLRYAHTAVVTRMRNPASHSQEATFRILLPETAFISGFTMILDGKAYKAYVKEKEEAKQIYTEAVSQGMGAAHITAKARDSNQFIVSVNVEPNTTAVFNLTYEELLTRRNGVYNHAVNLHPGTLVPKLTVTVHIKESQKITELRVPEIRTGNEIDATKDDKQNSNAVITRSNNDHEAVIKFEPNLEQQEQLMQIYAEKSKESASRKPHNYWSDSAPETTAEGVLGQFIVQYDVDRSKPSEVLVNEGYFVHFFAPTDLPPIKKHVVFVLDTSGSMMDRKIVQLREAMQTILSNLNPGDYFSIVEFASYVTVHDLKEAAEEPAKPTYYYYNYNKKAKLVPPSLATRENIDKAKVIVSRLEANGGTNIASALEVAIELINKGVNWIPATTPSPASKEDDSSTTEFYPTTAQTPPVNGSAVTESEKKESEQPEPIIIFLTDGEPTVGESSPNRIINLIVEKNFGENKATIFSLAFGEDADRKFLRKLSLRNDGFMRHIYEAADAALQLRDFYRQVSSPLLTHVKFTYPEQQVKKGSVTKHKFRTYYDGSEMVVAGRLEDATADQITPTVSGFCGVLDHSGKKRYEVTPTIILRDRKPDEDYRPLERLWAYLTIKQLLDEKDADEETNTVEKKEDSPDKKALEIALKYSFVTPLTSLVVVKPNATNAVDTESVDKSNDLRPQYGAGPIQPASLSAPPGLAFQSVAAYDSIAETFQSEDYMDVDDDTISLTYRSDIGFSGSHSYTGSMGLSGNRLVGGYSGISHHHNAAYPTSYSNHAAYFVQRQKIGTFHLTTPVPLYHFTSPPSVLLTQYHLLQYPWTEPLINATLEALLLPSDNSSVVLKLTKESTAPKSSTGDASCAKSTIGSAGVCVYLTRCEAAKTITIDTYKDTYCLVDTGFAGVCCPADKVDL